MNHLKTYLESSKVSIDVEEKIAQVLDVFQDVVDEFGIHNMGRFFLVVSYPPRDSYQSGENFWYKLVPAKVQQPRSARHLLITIENPVYRFSHSNFLIYSKIDKFLNKEFKPRLKKMGFKNRIIKYSHNIQIYVYV